jgi:broad specificity phosphatase PhoE
MNSVLESVEWGKPALSLLSKIKDIDASKPTIMFIRHSERPQGFYATLTETGKQAAYEYGQHLTQFKHVNLYHTYLERTKETATEVQKALIEIGIQQIGRSYGIVGNPTEKQRIEWESRPDNPPKRYLLNWVCGRYSPLHVRPSLDFVQQLTALMMMNLEASGPRVLDLYVCHDTWIAPLLLHWFGQLPETWVKYLEGFLVQPMKENLRAVLPTGTVDVSYPFWWKV